MIFYMVYGVGFIKVILMFRNELISGYRGIKFFFVIFIVGLDFILN